jgi:hypothetical protein
MQNSQRTPEDLLEATDEAITFLNSMVRLVERRELQEVGCDFAQAVLAMAGKIISPDDTATGLDPSRGAAEFFESFQRVPASVFSCVLWLVERGLREDLALVLNRPPIAPRAALSAVRPE